VPECAKSCRRRVIPVVGTGIDCHEEAQKVRDRPEVWLIVALGTFAATGYAALRLYGGQDSFRGEPAVGVVQPEPSSHASVWFESMRRYCNPVEVETRMRLEPPPASTEGTMHEAACYALAGRIDRAREAIERLRDGDKYLAAGVVFEAGHPAADAGDDIAAGPLMELVVEYWPNHYMALYHAGAARYELGDYALAEGYLKRFMVEYQPEDGWRSSARGMLEEIEKAELGRRP
jgi:tetratricopeptide (TPR) repeat protein